MNRILPAVLVLGLAARSLGFLVPPANGTPRSKLCHGLDCPKYTVTNTTKKWELRHYEATKWVATHAQAMNKSEVNSGMFQKLFKYISGANVNGTKIDMTAPVATKVVHGAGPNCRSDFTMHFMVPHQFWAAPPAPTDATVFIQDLPAMDVYVGSFGGRASDKDYIEAVEKLSNDLSNDGLDFTTDFFFEAGYDGPYTFFNRHNEVWLAKK